MVKKSKYSKFIYKARKRNLEVEISLTDYIKLKSGICFYCGTEPYILKHYCNFLGIKTPYPTIDRKDNNRGYTLENSVSCCFLCNKIKGNIFNSQEMVEIAKKYIVPKINAIKEEAWDEFTEDCRYDYDLD